MIDHALRSVMRQVVEHLDGFTCEVNDDYGHCVWLKHPDGRVLFARRGDYRNRDRIQISGSYPDTGDCYYGAISHDITVASGRAAKAIARDIQRRLLPACAEELAKVRAYIAAKTVKDARRAELGSRLAAIVGGTYTDDQRHNRGRVRWYRAGDSRWTVDLIGESAVVEIDMPATKVAQVLQALRPTL